MASFLWNELMVLMSVLHRCWFVHIVIFRILLIQCGALSQNQENREESNTSGYHLSSVHFWTEIYNCCCHVSSHLQIFLSLTHCGQQKWYSQGEVMTSFACKNPVGKTIASNTAFTWAQHVYGQGTFRSGGGPCCPNGTGMAELPGRQRHYSHCHPFIITMPTQHCTFHNKWKKIMVRK